MCLFACAGVHVAALLVFSLALPGAAGYTLHELCSAFRQFGQHFCLRCLPCLMPACLVNFVVGMEIYRSVLVSTGNTSCSDADWVGTLKDLFSPDDSCAKSTRFVPCLTSVFRPATRLSFGKLCSFARVAGTLMLQAAREAAWKYRRVTLDQVCVYVVGGTGGGLCGRVAFAVAHSLSSH